MKALSRWLTGACLIGVLAHAAAAGSDHERARQALASGEILPLTEILARAERLLEGRMIEAELEREDGLWVYEITLLRPDGRLVEALFDARGGELLELEGSALEDMLRRRE